MARGKPAPTHWLRGNAREWTPAHPLFVDTETRTTPRDDGELLTLRCWAGKAVDRREQRSTQPAERLGNGRDALTLAGWVDAMTVARKSSWLFTHNLTFDLTVTDLIGQLVAIGWQLGTEWSAHDRAPWFRLSKHGKSLALVDSVTWLPAKLGEVAKHVGLSKLADPAPDDEEGWERRCASDVEILAAAMLALMDWWDADQLGNWTVTGNGCGWNAMRHMTPAKTVLVKVGDGGRELERSAIFGGRRDATRWGDVAGGPFVTLDFEDAYPTLAANVRLPARRLQPFDQLDVDDQALSGGAIQVLANVEVECTEPRYPLRWGKAVWYPVGRFRTVLASPEIQEARDRGELRAIGAGFRYWCDGHLAGWARWVLDLAHGRIESAPAVAALPAKRWGRSVLGRFAQRIGDVEQWGPSQSVGWHAEQLGWPAEGCGGQLVDLAGVRWLVKQDQEADDAFPAVLAWVESYTRVLLNRMLDQLRPGAWISCNTDGAVIDLPAATHGLSKPRNRPRSIEGLLGLAGALCDQLAPSTWPLVPRPKDSYANLWLAGPATLLLDGRPAMSGIATGAKPTADGKLGAHVWPGLQWQMEHGDRRGFVRPLATYTVPTVTVHRFALNGGWTEPARAGVFSDGTTQLARWGEWSPMPATAQLAESQSRAVSRYLIP